MSYAVVRVQKMTMGSVRGIEIHDRREKDGISHSNPDIDWSRSGDNFDLHPAQNENFYRAVKSRIESLGLNRAVRKDAVVMAQVLVTSDTAFFDNLRDQGGDAAVRNFFQASYSFLSDRYGKENIISSTVHLDERTPHMHFNFVPVTADGRLCAKEVTARTQIISLHDKFREAVGCLFGLLRGEPKEAGKRRTHLETAEYKAVMGEVKQEQSRAAELKENNDELQNAINERYERQTQEFAKADELKRMEVENAKAEARQIRAAAAAEATKIIGVAPIERDRAVQERDKAAQEAARIAAEHAKLQSEVEIANQKKNALEGEIRGLTAQKAEWRSSLRSEDEITAIGEEVKPLLGEPYIKCKPDKFADLQKAAMGSFARQIRAQTAEKKAAELEKEMEKMISRFTHDREIAEIKSQYWNRLRASEKENEKIKTGAYRRITFIQEKGLAEEYKAWVDAHRQQERPRSQGMER